MVSRSNLYRTRAAIPARHSLEILVLLACLSASWHTVGVASAVELVDRNPFDPHRQPWKSTPLPPPELPVLTPQDMQIEAIVSFGSMRGILVQLDGKLRGTLPGNAAGKVRIAVGQSFGAGYVLESVAADQVVVLGGSARFSIPVVRRSTRGAAPPAAAMAADQRPAAPFGAAIANPPGSNPRAAGISAAPAAQSEAAMPPVAPAPGQVAAEAPPNTAQQTPSQQPMSLLEAIQAAQAAARNQQSPSAPVVNPFAPPKK